MDIDSLDIGKRYIFRTESWISPEGMVHPSCQRKLIFRGVLPDEAVGKAGIPSVEVGRGDGDSIPNRGSKSPAHRSDVMFHRI